MPTTRWPRPATVLLEAGENPKVVQERLGHTTFTTTMDIYSHVSPTMQRAAVDRFTAAVNGIRVAFDTESSWARMHLGLRTSFRVRVRVYPFATPAVTTNVAAAAKAMAATRKRPDGLIFSSASASLAIPSKLSPAA